MPSRRANAPPTTAAPGGAATKRLQVYQQLRLAIEAGTFAPGTRLPPTRLHAQALGVGRNTVLGALERLQAEGYVQARVGSGSYVADSLRAAPPLQAPSLPAAPALSRRGQLLADTARHWQPPLAPASAFRIGAPEVASFPFALWDRLARQCAAGQRQGQAQYTDPAGLPALREAIAQWLWVSRGVRCEAGQVVVTAGSQQAVDLVGRLLLDVGDEVIVEDPGYTGIRASLVGHGAAVRSIGLDAEGLDIASADRLAPRARLAVVTPTHQFPMGVRMSLARRLALIDWAQAHQAWLVEDDYDGEFQYGAHRTPALCSLPHGGRVLYIGTFSKALSPQLRLGYLVLPPELVPVFRQAKRLSDRHAPVLEQRALATLIDSGAYERHVRRVRRENERRRSALLDAIAQHLPTAARVVGTAAGLHVVLWLPMVRQQDEAAVVAAAREVGIGVYPVSPLYAGPPGGSRPRPAGLIVGYASLDVEQIRNGVRVLGAVLQRLIHARGQCPAVSLAGDFI